MLPTSRGSSGDEYKVGPFDPDTSSTMNTVGSYTGRWDISAVVESDADGDGYGDVTQDLCPSSKPPRPPARPRTRR